MLSDYEDVAPLLDQRRGPAYPEIAGKTAVLIKVEPALVSLHELEGRAINEDDLGARITPVLNRPFDFCRVVSINKEELLAKPSSGKRVDALTGHSNRVRAPMMASASKRPAKIEDFS
ncbi:hypothetical protein [Blastomonas sp. CCH1-A6]|uniref:hypothetical protein n=1 Tax=Blastomonas sp. CCH1-A6 TaxID=1768762 RepID=UPI0012E36BCD